MLKARIMYPMAYSPSVASLEQHGNSRNGGFADYMRPHAVVTCSGCSKRIDTIRDTCGSTQFP